jgi:tRNA1Val (adenine37-N6)-methyltransferase
MESLLSQWQNTKDHAMGVEYFFFRDFSMRQSSSGQRINTDSIVFGDAITELLPEETKTVLDIGSGTGILSFMISRANLSLSCTALEPDSDCFETLHANCNDNFWDDRIHAIKTTIQDFESKEAFDAIICNPPFFTSGPRARDQRRALARHADYLTPMDLSTHATRHLKPNGRMFLLTDAQDNGTDWQDCLTACGLHLERMITLADSPDAHPHALIHGYRLFEGGGIAKSHRMDYRQSRGGVFSCAMTQIRARWLNPAYQK